MIYSFDDYELDPSLFQLRRCGEPVSLEPKVFDLVIYLLSHRDRVVSKDELLQEVWPGVVVTESVLPHCVAAARRALGDDRTHQRVIQTVHGRGYRFVAPVRSHPSPEGTDPAPPDTGAATSGPTDALPLVGRVSTMARLRTWLRAAIAGHGHLVLLAGEPGVGKSRVAEEVAKEAHLAAMAVYTGRCYEGEGPPAFWPWCQVLRACAAVLSSQELVRDLGPGAPEVAELVPEIRRRIEGLAPPPPLPDEQARFRLFDSVASYLRRTARRQSLLLILDDLHWADEASLRLLKFLSGELRTSSILVLGTYRDTGSAGDPALSDLLGSLAAAGQRLTLQGLESQDVPRFVESVTGSAPSPPVAAALHRMTAGNPFFMQEIARLLASKGRLGSSESGDPLLPALPQSVRDTIGRRLDALSPPCHEMLRAASVLGLEFTLALLEGVVDLPRRDLLEHLDEARRFRLLHAPGGTLDRYAFGHALIRQTLYEELATPLCLYLHHRAGEAIENLGAGHPDPHLADIAHHFFRAAPGGEVQRAVEACARAAAHAYGLLAYEESARWYDRALQALALSGPQGDERLQTDTRRGELLLALGEAHFAGGDREQAGSAFESAAAIARHLDRPDLLARAALGEFPATELRAPPDGVSLSLVEEALASVGGDRPDLQARLKSRLVGSPPYSMERRDRLSREALEVARKSADPVALREALHARIWASLGPDGVQERLAVSEEILGLAARTGDPHMSLFGHDGAFGAHLLRGDPASAQRALGAYSRLARQLRQPVFLFQAKVMEAGRSLARGKFQEAERLLNEALEEGRKTVPQAHFIFTGLMSSLHLLRGDVLDTGTSSVLFGEMMELPYSWRPAIESSLALDLALRGKIGEAQGELDRLAEKGFHRLPRDEHWLITMESLSHLVLLLEDRNQAANLYRLLEPYAELFVVHDLLRSVNSSVSSILGKLAALLKRYDQGLLHFERAMEKEAAMGCLPVLQDTRAACAELLKRRGKSGDRERGRELVAQADQGRRELGMGGDS